MLATVVRITMYSRLYSHSPFPRFEIRYIRRKYQFSFTISCIKSARETTGNCIVDELVIYSERRSVYKITLVISGH